MIIIGWMVMRAGQRETSHQGDTAAVVYGLFAAAAVTATFPIWRLWLFGFNPTLDDLLRLRCLGI